MPYKNVPAELFFEHEGIKLYNTYLDNDIDNEKLLFLYVTDPYDEVEDAIDIRLLPIWDDVSCPPLPVGYSISRSEEHYANDDLWEIWLDIDTDLIKEVLIIAIDKQLI